ncbi:MAG: hypothetical protein J5750_07310 [Clostridiales bacterium]|nr:hypothetical protein [Clostridiales bacterium]
MKDIYIYTGIVIVIILVVGILKVITQIAKKGEVPNDDEPVFRLREPDLSENVETLEESKMETGPMIYFANDPHHRKDNVYRFNYKFVNGSWRAYILQMPSLGNRDDSGYITHRLFDGDEAYVCWDSSVTSLKDMQIISRAWADNIQKYIATGKHFG